MIVTTEAVVLKAMKYRDTSKIVTLYTRAFGRLSVIAKGARTRNNKFGASLEPLSRVSAVVYKKEQRDLHLLSQCELLASFRRIPEDIERLATAMTVIEIVHAVAHQEERNEELFNLLIQVLETIEGATKNVRNALYSFEMRLSGILGFRPNLETCLRCGGILDETRVVPPGAGFDLLHGGVFCTACAQGRRPARTLSPPALQVLRTLQRQVQPVASTSMTLKPEVRTEVAEALRHYLRSHIEVLGDMRSDEVFASIIQENH